MLAELFYFRDYWRPPSLFGVATISVEDFLFGFTIAALSYTVFAYADKQVFSEIRYRQYKHLYAIFFVTGVVSMLIFSVFLQMNSIFVSSSVFIVCTGIIAMLRRDLVRPALFSVALLLPLLVFIYIILFDGFAPLFWEKYWLLSGWGIMLLGNIPVTEIIWYVSWIALASISYPFASGRTFIDSKRQ